jgi:hypothetical protein
VNYFQITPNQGGSGSAFSVFQQGCSNRIQNKECYKPNAAGPRYLAAEGLGETPIYLKYQPSHGNLQGLEELIPAGVLDKALAGAVERAWPTIEPKIRYVAQDYAKSAAIAVGAVVVLQLATLYVLARR